MVIWSAIGRHTSVLSAVSSATIPVSCHEQSVVQSKPQVDHFCCTTIRPRLCTHHFKPLGTLIYQTKVPTHFDVVTVLTHINCAATPNRPPQHLRISVAYPGATKAATGEQCVALQLHDFSTLTFSDIIT